MNANLLRICMNWWPPFLGAEIHVDEIKSDYRGAKVSLKRGLLNRNIVGVHFGGSLFAMTDPFFMMMVSHNLGKGYIVWDKAANIDFIKPGRSNVYAKFELTQHQIDGLVAEAASGEKVLKDFCVDILDQDGGVVARVCKTLYIRKKPN